MTQEEFDKFEDASQIICGECIIRSECACNKCAVRKTLDSFYSLWERIDSFSFNMDINLVNWSKLNFVDADFYYNTHITKSKKNRIVIDLNTSSKAESQLDWCEKAVSAFDNYERCYDFCKSLDKEDYMGRYMYLIIDFEKMCEYFDDNEDNIKKFLKSLYEEIDDIITNLSESDQEWVNENIYN